MLHKASTVVEADVERALTPLLSRPI